MAENLKGKYFVGSRGFYGTNSVKYQNIEIEVTKYNHDYANPVTSFDWGNTKKGANLLASAILNTIASPTVARVYANKYTQNVIQNLREDEWKMEAIEVARWINNNTDYTIELDEESEKKAEEEEAKRKQEEIEKEKRRIKREEEFQKQIQEKLKKRSKNEAQKKQNVEIAINNVVDTLCGELEIKRETLAKILDVPMDTINNWRLENEMPKLARKAIEFYKAGVTFKEKNSKLKIELKKFQEQLLQKQTEIDLAEAKLNRYRKFINALDIPALYKKFKEL
ncbi:MULTISPECIES: DUF6166 domain-containing protein [Sulfurimonas]|uniref:DUF6166 domain-containing protein n=1 Tax=Sulfurimonas TaxID=202746 RepID=UPI00126488BE|nr:DUF6166 domain-containing protein [Sulfurimonas indica]